MVIEECNVLDINLIDESQVNINKQIKPIKAYIYKKYGKNITSVFNALEKLSSNEIEQVLETGIFMNYEFDNTMFNIKYDINLDDNIDKSSVDIVHRDYDYGIYKDCGIYKGN